MNRFINRVTQRGLTVILFFVMGTMSNLIIAQTNMKKEALIVIDIQNDYFDGGANPLVGSMDASLNAKNILDVFREKSFPVIHIQHLSVHPGSTFFLPNTTGAEIHKNVAPIDGEKVIVKNYPNSFRDTELLNYLESEGITNLVVVGMMTQMCVDATVRAAKDFGFDCTVISDACATKDLEVNGKAVKAEDVQTAFLAALNYFYSKVISKEKFLNEKAIADITIEELLLDRLPSTHEDDQVFEFSIPQF